MLTIQAVVKIIGKIFKCDRRIIHPTKQLHTCLFSLIYVNK